MPVGESPAKRHVSMLPKAGSGSRRWYSDRIMDTGAWSSMVEEWFVRRTIVGEGQKKYAQSRGGGI